MLKAYFKVAENMEEYPDVDETNHFFHRTKKCAFFVGARRLDKDGFMPEEKQT